MLGPCRGPALLELSDEAARKPALPAPAAPPTPLPPTREERLAAARALLGQARRPVIIAGLEARGAAAAETRALAQAVGAPVLVTYKAKGVVADDDPLFAGVFTGGAAEACAAAGLAPRAAVDAGAHMFSATSFWPGRAPHGVLISNGLATMGFALPAGIAAALAEPDRPVLAFTGDGGLLMCLGELATAAAVRTRLVVIVFNDAGLSLIALKKAGRAVPEESLAWAPPGFADVARGLGCAGVTVETEDAYRAALTTALATDGPTVIDVRIDPTGYPAQMAAARGWIGGCSSINMCA
jgi:thiamine pyrophosphate-dependent acetolactate synthase large subunit-like protein